MSDVTHDRPTIEVRSWVVYRSERPSGSRMLCPKSEHPPPEGFTLEDECDGDYGTGKAMLDRLAAVGGAP